MLWLSGYAAASTSGVRISQTSEGLPTPNLAGSGPVHDDAA